MEERSPCVFATVVDASDSECASKQEMLRSHIGRTLRKVNPI